MKKFVLIFCTALIIAALTGCNSGETKSDNSENNSSQISDNSDNLSGSDNSDNSGEPESQEPVDIASLPVKHVDWGNIFDNRIEGSFTITDRLGDNFYGEKGEQSGYVEYSEILKNAGSGKETPLKFPENFPDWSVGSGVTATLENRYYYEWKSYTKIFSPNSEHDMRLTKIDGVTGEVTVVDEIKSLSPFIYLVKLDERSLLSYTAVPIEFDDSGYSTLTTASIYYSDGTKKEIIREKYRNEADWTDSIGILPENFAVNNGEIYGFGRQRIGGEYKFFLYHYDKEGTLLDTKELPGMEEIMGSDSAIELFFVGDYLVFRTYQSLSRYICKITEQGVTLLADGSQSEFRIGCAVSGTKIFFIENNVDGETAEIKDKEIPLYSIDTATDEITAVNFEVPLEKPYFVDLKALSNGDLLFQYCPNGSYDPLNSTNYILPISEVNSLIGSAEPQS